MQVAKIETTGVISALKPIWSTKPATANRVRQQIEAVLDDVTALGIRAGDIPARMRGYLDHHFLIPTKERVGEHHPALPNADIADFISDSSTRSGLFVPTLGFTNLTAARSGETRSKWKCSSSVVIERISGGQL